MDQRAAAIAQPDFDQYMADQIDEATLKQRKEQARATALKECALLTGLESSFAAFACCASLCDRDTGCTVFSIHMDGTCVGCGTPPTVLEPDAFSGTSIQASNPQLMRKIVKILDDSGTFRRS